MSIFRRGEIWYASFTPAGGKRIKQSLGTSDKQQAQELHDKLKAESWREAKMGELTPMTLKMPVFIRERWRRRGNKE